VLKTGPAWLLLLFCVVVFAEDEQKKEEEPQLSEKEIEAKVEEIAEEYDAIRASQDLEPSRRRRILARRLAKYKHKDSYKLLLRILQNDGDMRARIDAMNSLSKIADLAAAKKMFRIVNRDKKILSYYLGPALMGATDPEIGPWVVKKILPSSHKALRMSAVEAVGALRTKEAREPLLELRAKLQPKLEAKGTKKSRASDKVNENMLLYYEVLRSIGQIGGDDAKQILYDAAVSEDWRVRLAAAEVLTIHFRDPQTLQVQKKLLKDEKPIVREIAGVSTGAHKLEPLFPELVLLMREGNLRSKHKSFIAMKLISGQDYGYAPDAWAKWWSDKKKGKLTKEGDIAKKERMSVATYYNFKIFSDRILFVIDVSGSMNWPTFHPNRIEVAKRELVKAIKSLNEKTMFNVATFAGHVDFWQNKGEVLATKDNVAKALKWVDAKLLPRGGTNTYDALVKSLHENPLIDTVFFLSDGIPSVGKYELPEEILIHLRNQNRYRKVIFNTVALAIGKASIEKAQKYEDPDEMAAFMKKIADLTGGTCLDIRKPFLDK
jgi:hypothetical protein